MIKTKFVFIVIYYSSYINNNVIYYNPTCVAVFNNEKDAKKYTLEFNYPFDYEGNYYDIEKHAVL